MGALEALNGLLLFGLTTAFLYAHVQRVWPPAGRRSRSVRARLDRRLQPARTAGADEAATRAASPPAELLHAEENRGLLQRDPHAPQERDAHGKPGGCDQPAGRGLARCRWTPRSPADAAAAACCSAASWASCAGVMKFFSATGRISRLQMNPSTRSPASTYIVVLYTCDFGTSLGELILAELTRSGTVPARLRPTRPSAAGHGSRRPCWVPNRSDRYAGTVAKPPPYIDRMMQKNSTKSARLPVATVQGIEE